MPDRTMVTAAHRVATGRCLQLDSSRRFNGTFAVRPAAITPIRPSRSSGATRPVATAAGLPADPIPSELRAAAAESSDIIDTEQRQRELRPFLVPSPTRGTTSCIRQRLPLSRSAVVAGLTEVPPSSDATQGSSATPAMRGACERRWSTLRAIQHGAPGNTLTLHPPSQFNAAFVTAAEHHHCVCNQAAGAGLRRTGSRERQHRRPHPLQLAAARPPDGAHALIAVMVPLLS